MSALELLDNYSPLDRLLHRFAFRSGGLQTILADMEDTLFGKQLAGIGVANPLLVTALPRAGTTLLLEMLHGTGEFASHTYRHMPFVLSPMLWRKLSGGFRSRNNESLARAHGDGMEITLDSVESFEEIIWRRFFTDHYAIDRIHPWARCDDEDFTEFLGQHIRKILYLADPGNPGGLRYLSKNNLNVARLGCLDQAFDRPVALVIFRHPLDQARSLLRHHRLFLDLHRQSSFAREYMRGIGHFDFGANLLPVDYGGWLDRAAKPDPTTLDFWLLYWIATSWP